MKNKLYQGKDLITKIFMLQVTKTRIISSFRPFTHTYAHVHCIAIGLRPSSSVNNFTYFYYFTS